MMNVTNEHRTETFTLYNHVTVTLEQINSESLKQKGWGGREEMCFCISGSQRWAAETHIPTEVHYRNPGE